MRCGLFGKLGAKRDFIAISTPREFLHVWEPWVQACVSASRNQLKDDWQDAFLTAPVWRFWLGADICGSTVLGATMPSVDGVGRYYPLTLLAVADANGAIPPPTLEPQESWFDAIEAFLLSTLHEGAAFDAITAALDGLPTPSTAGGKSPAVVQIADTMVGATFAGRPVKDVFSELQDSHHDALAAVSFWWTEGGGNFPPLALCCRGLPDPFQYVLMLGGKLDSLPTSEST